LKGVAEILGGRRYHAQIVVGIRTLQELPVDVISEYRQ